MNIIQFVNAQHQSCVGTVVDLDAIEVLHDASTVYELAQAAIQTQSTLATAVNKHRSGQYISYQQLVDEKRLQSPLHHPDPAHLLVSGTGLTHLGSADTRAAMHKKLQVAENELSDSMKMFRLGVEGGKPKPGEVGVAPEWFYKGDGSIVAAPEQVIASPDFALDIGDEAEIVGLYIIGADCKPYRVGFALGNEFSDHKTEKINYLYSAHSKLRPCSFGPEIHLGELPAQVNGVSRIKRNNQALWEKEFLTGADNMSHSIANLEHHHFKYVQFLRPGDVHVHFFGTGTLSFADGIEAQAGDVFELESATFGRPLRNTLAKLNPSAVEIKAL